MVKSGKGQVRRPKNGIALQNTRRESGMTQPAIAEVMRAKGAVASEYAMGEPPRIGCCARVVHLSD
jgi:hypothetical protein